jgi:hypothetical protein
MYHAGDRNEAVSVRRHRYASHVADRLFASQFPTMSGNTDDVFRLRLAAKIEEVNASAV